MKKGFTLFELLLSISLIAILFGISVPIYQSFQVRNDLDITRSNIIDSMRRSQILSLASKGGTTWGVRIENSSIIIFQGADYLSRDPLLDEIYDIPLSIIPSGINEIIFSRLDGSPSLTGVITLTSSINEVKTITINEKGIFTF